MNLRETGGHRELVFNEKLKLKMIDDAWPFRRLQALAGAFLA